MVPPYSRRISRLPLYSSVAQPFWSPPIKGLGYLLWQFYGEPGKADYLLGQSRFRSPLVTASRLISFPPATEMFHFTGLFFEEFSLGRAPAFHRSLSSNGSSDCFSHSFASLSYFIPRNSSDAFFFRRNG